MRPVAFVVFGSLFLILCLEKLPAAQTKRAVPGYSQVQVEGISADIADHLVDRTDYWWHRGEYTRITSLDRIITEAEPQYVEQYSTGGWLMESNGDYTDAEKYYRLGATRNPRNSFIWYNLGFFYFSTMKDYPSAIKAFQVSSHCPDGGINDWKMLAHSYERNMQLTDAIGVWQMLQQQNPQDSVVARNLAKDEKALQAAAPSAGQ